MVLPVLAGAALRLLALGRQSFWYDEAVSVELARSGLGDLLTGRVRDLGNPPLYPALLHVWMALFGAGDGAVRALSAVLGIATLPLAFLVARRLVGPRAALAGLWVLALSPFHLQMAQEARAYALLTFLGVASVAALLRALDPDRGARRWPWWALHAAATGGMLLTHYFGFFLVLAEAVFVLVRHRRDRPVLGRALVSFVAAGLVFSFWLPSLVGQLSVHGNLAR